ncbi:hypothetical protein [Nonomuraea sp. NPDC050783]|uniref:hypothetical protein n=1 Tax=Nonomuraea sp. NPDC050783 TaxID=3154634 RepID=UPI00346658A2
MTALLMLEPRLVDDSTLEPRILFDDDYAGLHLRLGCVPTCVCRSGSSNCQRSTAV